MPVTKSVLKTMNRRAFIQTLGLSSGLALTDRFAFAADQATDVVVIGAGISGMYAAYELQKAGMTVRVLEASQRIGGRMQTLDDLPWKPNGGAVEVGDGYARLIGLAQQVGVNMVPPPPEEARGGGTVFVVGDEVVLDKNWATSSVNKLAENEKKILPHQLEYLLMNGKNPLQSLDDWYDPKYAAFDVPFSTFLKNSGASDQALQLINANANTNDIATTSALNVMRSMTFRTKGSSKKTLRIEGGSQRLPEAVASKLNRPVEMESAVVEINDHGTRVTVKCQDGRTVSARHVVVTVPFSALRRVKFTKSLPDLYQQAIQDLPYTQITQLHVAAKVPFWETDGLPTTMWTDGIFGRIFVNRGLNGKQGLLAWSNGTDASVLDKMTDKRVVEAFLAEMKKNRPASEGQIEVLKINSWGKNPLARGAYYHLAPGQAAKFFPALLQPVGRVHFSGEHLGLQNSGMEAACESAAAVVNKITAT